MALLNSTQIGSAHFLPTIAALEEGKREEKRERVKNPEFRGLKKADYPVYPSKYNKMNKIQIKTEIPSFQKVRKLFKFYYI